MDEDFKNQIVTAVEPVSLSPLLNQLTGFKQVPAQFMPLATGNQFHAFNWTELTIDDYIIGRVEVMERYDNQTIITNSYPISVTTNPGFPRDW